MLKTAMPWLALWGIATLSSAHAQTLTHLYPFVLAPGSTTRVAFYGKDLGGVTGVWTSFPSTTKRASDAPNNDTQVFFDITIPDTAAVGMYGIRLATSIAMTDAKLLLIDDLPIQLEAVANVSPQTAQVLSIPVSVQGYMPAEQSRYFSMEIAQPQRLSLEAVGHRFGTGFDPFIRITNVDGKEVISHDNDEGLGFDFRFDVDLPAGKYLVEFRDTRYQGSIWPYALRLGSFPIARATFPLGVMRGVPTLLSLPGRSASDYPAFAMTSATIPFSREQVSARGNAGTSWFTVAVADELSERELEPNNSFDQANPLALGRAIEGRLEGAGDVDAFRFAGKPNQPIYFRIDAKRLGSPIDATLRILDSQGKVLAESDDEGESPGEPEITFTPPAEQGYAVVVDDLNHRGGPTFSYRLRTSSPRREMVLRPAVDRLVIPRGSSVPIVINVDRAGLGEAVDLIAQTTTEGLKGRETKVPPGATSIVMTLDASQATPTGAGSLIMRGSSKDVPGSSRVGDVSSLLRPTLENLLLLPPSLESCVAITVVERPFFRLSGRVDGNAAARYAPAAIIVEAAKEKFFDEEIALAVENLPPNVAVKPQPLKKGEGTVAIPIEFKKVAPLGSFPIIISGVSTAFGRPCRVYAEVLPLNIRQAVTLQFAESELSLTPGSKGKLTVKADRLSAYNGPLEVSLVNLPPGVTAPKAVIPEGGAEVGIELSVDPAAALTSVDNVVAQSSFKIGEIEEQVTTPNMRVKIVAP